MVIVLLWTLVIVSPLLFMDDSVQDWRDIYIMWIECAVVGVTFLINRLILVPWLFTTKKYTKYIIALSILFVLLGAFVIVFDGVRSLIDTFVGEPSHRLMSEDLSMNFENMHHIHRPMRGGRPSGVLPPVFSIIPPSISVMAFSAVVIALDMGLNISFKWVISEQKQAEINKERISTQLTNLQSQVSPHFFMNTLNNIHALVDIDSERAKQTIIELSSLMDYLLHESSTTEKVSLRKELDFINSYINLMRLRFPEKVKIDFSHDKIIPTVKIPPLLFLNFIENSFKYGVNYDKTSFIKINFSFNESEITMEAINTNHSSTVKRQRRGIGISNSRKRLKLLYDNMYSLQINENDETYCVTLKIPIV